MRHRCVVAVLFCICSSFPAAAQDIWRVHASASPGGDGLTWTTAFQDLQDALATAHSQPLGEPQEIWIASGTYLPDQGSGLRSSTFLATRPIALLGGFSGTELAAADRSPTTPLPVLSGDIGVPTVRGDNALHVITLRAGSAQTRIASLIVRDGTADDAGIAFGRAGGGILIEEGWPLIEDCLIFGCTARDGAGIYADSGEPTIRATVIRQNVATTSGGGVYLADGGTIEGSIFDSNTGPSGGGLFVCCGGGAIRDTLFQSNFATNGGGIFYGVGGPPITRCVFLSNSATRGAGVYASRSGGKIASCRFASNTSNEGGGVYFDLTASMVNCLFTRNIAFSFGGAIYARNSPTIVGCTIYANGAGFTGGGIHHASGNTGLANSILWANTDASGITQQAQVVRVAGTLVPTACCVEGWTGSLGGSLNIGTAPTLVSITGSDGLLGTIDDDPRLSPVSVCIDAGSNILWPPDTGDLDHDGDVLEITPLDGLGSARALDDDATLDTGLPGAGFPGIADIGCAEFLPGCIGDLNGDQVIDAADFIILAANFGAAQALPSQGDINQDTLVNTADFTVLAARFGAQCF